jgi:magnesium transporter
MLKFIKKVSRKKGLPPGSLTLVGTERKYDVQIRLINYSEQDYEEKIFESAGKCSQKKDPDKLTWINVDGIHDLQVIEKTGRCFELHSLLLEDVVNTDHRPKIDDYEDNLFIVLKRLWFSTEKDSVIAEQISLVLGKKFVVSFQENNTDIFRPVRDRLLKGKGRLRKMDSDYLAYCLLDTVVDGYFTVLEKIGEKLENMEEELIDRPATDTLQRIYSLKKEMIFLRKSVWPLRAVIAGLEKTESELINEQTYLFIRDLYDHVEAIIETIESFRDILSEMLNTYHSNLSNDMNSVMKVLTIIATIFIPITFIAGVYGMNFANMPELQTAWGYPAALVLMFLAAAGMLVYFRVKKWL